MPRKKRSKPNPIRAQSGKRQPKRRWWVWGLVVCGTVLVLWFGRPGLVWYAQRAAAQELQIGAVTAAQAWISWAAWLNPGDGRTDLIAASCFRHLQNVAGYDEALKAARRKNASPLLVERETTLGLIRAGGLKKEESGQLGPLIEAGMPPDEIARASVLGYLLQNEIAEAKRVLDAWSADRPNNANVAYVGGVYWEHLHQYAKAQAEFEEALARQPRHELALMALASLLERQGKLEESLPRFLQWATQCQGNDNAQAGLARILRKTGQIGRARAVLESHLRESELSKPVAAEMAQIEFESADYEKAADWLRRMPFGENSEHSTKITAASAVAFGGDGIAARELFRRADDSYRHDQIIADLKVRLQANPHDERAMADLKRLSSPEVNGSVAGEPSALDLLAESRRGTHPRDAASLYLLHCSACHGSEGYGDGLAAPHLHPRPRDLRHGNYRLVSSENAVPSVEDVETILRLGMPGTAMRAFDNLTNDEIRILAEESLRLRREGLQERLVAEWESEGEEVDEDELHEVVELATEPGKPVQVPTIGEPDRASVVRGKDAYAALGCDKCHGADGRGVWDLPLFDEQEKVTLPRDLVSDPFKGERTPASIYLRVFLGMPGTPHPSCSNVPEQQLVDLVQYCRSIAAPAQQELTNYQRLVRDRDRVNLAALDEVALP